jgi:hypothetical protein
VHVERVIVHRGILRSREQGAGNRRLEAGLGGFPIGFDLSTQPPTSNLHACSGFCNFRIVRDRIDSDGGGVARTRSVGDDFTSAVLRRCSQSPRPRASSCLTYTMNSLTSPASAPSSGACSG